MNFSLLVVDVCIKVSKHPTMLEIFGAELTNIFFILLIFLTLLECFAVQVGHAGMQDVVWSLCSRCIMSTIIFVGSSEGLEGRYLRLGFSI